GLIRDQRPRAQALPHEVAGRLLLEPGDPAPHHPRPQGCRRGRHHGLRGSRVRRGGPVSVAPAVSMFVAAFILLNAIVGVVTYITLLERKFAARMQSRIGPYYVGWPHGWLQPIADAVQQMIKEDGVATLADRVGYHLAPRALLLLCMLI